MFQSHFTMLTLQDLVNRVPLTPVKVTGVASILPVVYIVFRWSLARQRIKRLGQKAPAVAYWAPFGMNLLQVPFCAPFFGTKLMVVSRY